MTHGTEGKVFDRIDLVWRYPEELHQINEIRRELAFLRKAKQGELQTPMLIKDGMEPVQSMLDGKMYDSKSTLRRTYKEGGVVEVGNDPAYTDPSKMQRKIDNETYYEKKKRLEERRGAVERAFSLVNLTTSTPGDDIRIKDFTPAAEHQGKFHGMKD